MSKKTRRRLEAGLKALEVLRNEATVAALATKYQLHPNWGHDIERVLDSLLA